MATFPSTERIKSKKLLDTVYKEGEVIKQYPFILRYLKVDFEKGGGVQIVIAIPKKTIKKAVKRNRLRRQIKEIYRHNKSNLLSQFKEKNKGLALFLVYTGKGDEDYHHLENKLTLLLKKLENTI
ncbi:MAG: ribonuclease P protein component [Crocinitomicaceae bacterium]